MEKAKEDILLAMRELGFSYEKLGMLTHKGGETICRQLSEEGNPRLDTLIGMAHPLGCEIRAMRKEIMELIRSDNLEFMRQKSLEYSNRITELEEQLAATKDMLERTQELADARLAHCHELDAQIVDLSGQLRASNEHNHELTMRTLDMLKK